MSSRTKRFLPNKITRNNRPLRTKPEDFDSVIRESFDFSRKLCRKRAASVAEEKFLTDTYQGQIEKRRKEVLRRGLIAMMERQSERLNGIKGDDSKGSNSGNRYGGNSNSSNSGGGNSNGSNSFTGSMPPEDIAVSWIELNAPMASYTKMERQFHVLFAAAIWILDRITEQEDWRRKLFPLLPRNDRETEEFCEPDVWDSQYEYDLITSVVNVLYYRNLNVSRNSSKGKKTRVIDTSAIDTFEERLQLWEDNPQVLTSEYTATHEMDEDWRDHPEEDQYRERFRKLLSLIPQEDIDDIVDEFRFSWRKWVDLFFDGIAAINKDRESLDKKKAQIAAEHNQIVDELEVLIDAVESKRQAQTVRKDGKKGSKGQAVLKPGANPLLVNPGNPLMNPLLANPNPLMNPGKAKPSIEQFIKNQGAVAGAANLTRGYMNSDHSFSGVGTGIMGNKTGDPDLDSQLKRMESLYMRCQSLEESFDKLIDETDAIYRKERAFSLQIASYGRISNGFEEYYTGLPDTLKEPMHLPDVYGMCFAFLYLIETGDDLPWLYGATHGFMTNVCESLPWGMREYEEIGDPVWDNADYEYEDVPKTASIPDWNERKYADRESEYYFPRSLAQILYEETGCLLPRDVTLYYPEYETIRDYGIRGKDAGIMMLMSAVLSTARRQTKASNFDSEFLRFLEKNPATWLEEDEENGVDEEADEAQPTETQSDSITAKHVPQPKDEKDLLIDQLQDELKRARTSIHAAEVETRNTRKELAATRSVYEREHRELADLREIVFNAQFDDNPDTVAQPASPADIDFPYETQKRTTVFGGHDTFLKAIKPMLPTVRFIDASYMTFSPELVRNSDIVWVQTNCISHPMFWNVVKYAKQFGVQLRYLGYASAEKCAEQIVEADKR